MKKKYYKMIDPPSMSGLIKLYVEHYADQPCLTYVDGEGFSYREVVTAAWKVAKLLDKKNIKKEAHIMLFSQSSPWWGIVYLGITASGRVVVPVLPDFPSKDVAHIVKHSDSELAFVSAKLLSKIKKAEVGIALCGVEGFLEIGSEEYNPESPKDFIQSFTEDQFQEAVKYFEEKNVSPDTLCSIIYTSGTTGMSKGVMLSHRNICTDANSANPVPPPSPTVNTLSILPLSHSYECTVGFITTTARGCHIHYLRRNLSPAALLPALQKVKPELMLSVPLLLEKIYRKQILPQFTKKRISRFLYKIPLFRILLNRIAGKKLMKLFGGRMIFFGIGGAGLDPEVEKFLREARFPYAMGYGLTETSPLVTGFNLWTSRYRSTGHLIDNVEVKIDNPDPKTGEGEVFVKGPTIMLGYYKDEEKTREAMTEDGYFKTGDLGSLKKNHLFLSGRIKNMILTANGENIYPDAIESLINRFDFVEESMVFQAEDKSLVARICLNYDEFEKSLKKNTDEKVDGRESFEAYLKEIKRLLNKQVSKFSQIKTVILQIEPLQKTPTNKIKRFLHNKITKEDEENAFT